MTLLEEGRGTVGHFHLTRVLKDVGRVARMSTDGSHVWLTFGMPEYMSGKGFAQFDLDQRQLLRLDDALTSSNVLCVACADGRVWVGTERGLGIYHGRKRLFEEMKAPRGPIFEIRPGRDDRIWLGGRGVLWRLDRDGHLTEFLIPQLPELHRIAEGNGFVVCGGDSRGGALIYNLDRNEPSSIRSEILPSSYVRDIFALGGLISIVGSSNLQLDAVTGKLRGEQWGTGDLVLAGAFFSDALLLGSIGGLTIITKSAGRLIVELGETTALLPLANSLSIAAGGDLWLITDARVRTSPST